MDDLFCPHCGQQTLRLIERIEPQEDTCDQVKEIRTCDGCENMVYIYLTDTY